MKTPAARNTPPILSVSQLNRLAKGLLEDHFPSVLVEGEISNLATPASGHWYLTLKDGAAQIRCAMFRNRNMFVRPRPKDGQKVLVKGKLSLYEGRGDYQLIIDQMEETGAGALRREFELLKQRLQAEGLFDDAHKQPLPTLPRHLAIITSPTGAAVRDVLQVLQRRFPALPVTIIPVSVQGQSSAAEICTALALVNQRQGCLATVDLVLLTRGGGSLEDLWSFNDEKLARAIHASQLPVISAVGHEVDFTIADFVADVRAPTPSAAAEILSPDQATWLQRLQKTESRLWQLQQNRLRAWQQELRMLSKRLQHPGRRLQEQSQRIDDMEARLRRSMANKLLQEQRRIRSAQQALSVLTPRHQLQALQQRITHLQQRLLRASATNLAGLRKHLMATAHALDTVSPLATLARGYSITTDADGTVLSRVEQVRSGATIRTRLAHGNLVSIVTSE